MDNLTWQAVGLLGVTAMAAILGISAPAQIGDPASLIKEKLVSLVKLTKAAADHSDIVTAGDVVLLHKDGLVMCSSTSAYAASNSYINGVLAANQKNRGKDAAASAGKAMLGRFSPFGGGSVKDAVNNACPQRKFVAGEKLWITSIAITPKQDAILVSTFSDPYNDVRYYGEIVFPFPGGKVPPVDDFVKTVSEVITVQPADDKDSANSGSQSTQSAAQAPQALVPAAQAVSTPMPDIAPPPPPADAPVSQITVGETEEQVVTALGPPANKATNLPHGKEIFFYKDRKITFINGKVYDVQ